MKLISKLFGKKKKGKEHVIIQNEDELAPDKVESIIEKYQRIKDENVEECNIAILIDASSSMLEHIRTVKDNIKGILDRIYKESNSKKIYVYLCAYRDYFNQKDLFVSLDKTNNVKTMKIWLNNLVCMVNTDIREALEYGLERVIELPDITMVYVISDAPGHTRNELIQHDHVNSRIVMEVAEDYARKRVPIYPLYVGADEETIHSFKELAKRTNGVSGKFEKESILDMVVMGALSLIKGRQALLMYQQKYKISFEAQKFADQLMITHNKTLNDELD